MCGLWVCNHACLFQTVLHLQHPALQPLSPHACKLPPSCTCCAPSQWAANTEHQPLLCTHCQLSCRCKQLTTSPQHSAVQLPSVHTHKMRSGYIWSLLQVSAELLGRIGRLIVWCLCIVVSVTHSGVLRLLVLYACVRLS